MQQYKKIIALVLSIGILAGCQTGLSDNTSNTTDTTSTGLSENKNYCDDLCKGFYDVADMSGYDIDSKNFLDIRYQEITDLLSGDEFTGIIYLGFSRCPWCYEAVPVLDEIANENGIYIYYANRYSEYNEKNENFDAVLETLTTALGEQYEMDLDEYDNPRIYYPTVLAIKNGKVIAHNVGTVEGHNAHERTMSDEERAQLKKLYTSYAQMVNEETKGE